MAVGDPMGAQWAPTLKVVDRERFLGFLARAKSSEKIRTHLQEREVSLGTKWFPLGS